jgi:environmental stress-induced protein Ves
MPAFRLIPHSSFVKGMWRNGRGISWDIASDRPGESEFGWRLAIAEIAASGPFSLYGPVNRVFTLIEGDGVDLSFEDSARLAVHERFVPHVFPCDIATECKLHGQVAKVLNLFTARGSFAADVKVIEVDGDCPLSLTTPLTLLFVLQGAIEVDGIAIPQHDAVEIRGAGKLTLHGVDARLYIAEMVAGPG